MGQSYYTFFLSSIITLFIRLSVMIFIFGLTTGKDEGRCSYHIVGCSDCTASCINAQFDALFSVCDIEAPYHHSPYSLFNPCCLRLTVTVTVVLSSMNDRLFGV